MFTPAARKTMNMRGIRTPTNHRADPASSLNFRLVTPLHIDKHL